ncbi:MAG: Cof-type HAD-IIB family hydrolase [Chitinivibrionales bacterium]|nr:Cof-type HAD-IIB family hydrolase [Chitinivibrionales bacterium]MBD3395061.1 Cof-type HAD-IIB family hydrolase [Chitinivibrionales bacterium]
MPPKLIALDLDGTLLTTGKRLTPANRAALEDMARCGVRVVLASGRLGSSMAKVVAGMDVDIAMMTLNGAAVYTSKVDRKHLVYEAPLQARFADALVAYAEGKPLALNYYIDDTLFTIQNGHNRQWIDLYYQQTQTDCELVDNLDMFAGRTPSKVIFVGDPSLLDRLEKEFRAKWDQQVYVCRTWEYYLEFLNLDANKAKGITALANAFGIDLREAAAFGDGENDMPMIEAAGAGIAMQNAPDKVKKVAGYVSPWTNDEDAVAKEWDRLKRN